MKSPTRYPHPWIPAGPDAEGLLNELQFELSVGHPLHGLQLQAIARRIDTDDVLFAIGDSKSVVMVHLTWSGQTESQQGLPFANQYDTLEDWAEQWVSVE